jgi:hypothetical protein
MLRSDRTSECLLMSRVAVFPLLARMGAALTGVALWRPNQAVSAKMRRRYLLLRLMVAAAVVGLGGCHAVAEAPEKIIAAKIRLQGFACDKPVSAERDRAASKPNEAVWLLKCDDYSYRVRLVPNMAADVRFLDSDRSAEG